MECLRKLAVISLMDDTIREWSSLSLCFFTYFKQCISFSFLYWSLLFFRKWGKVNISFEDGLTRWKLYKAVLSLIYSLIPLCEGNQHMASDPSVRENELCTQ